MPWLPYVENVVRFQVYRLLPEFCLLFSGGKKRIIGKGPMGLRVLFMTILTIPEFHTLETLVDSGYTHTLDAHRGTFRF